MIVETRRLWFKKAVIFLEDNLPPALLLEKKYSSVSIISHRELDLPGWSLRKKDTSLIDLTLSPEEIFRRFSDTTRNEIRRTEKDEKFIFRHGKNFSELYVLYVTFEKSQGRKAVSRDEMNNFSAVWIEYDGEIVYGLYLAESMPYMRVRSIFSKRLSEQDPEMVKKISNAGRRLFWETFLWARARGFVSLDLASVNQENPATVNIAKFKLSFGGDTVPEYTYSHKSDAFIFIEKMFSLRNSLRGILRK